MAGVSKLMDDVFPLKPKWNSLQNLFNIAKIILCIFLIIFLFF